MDNYAAQMGAKDFKSQGPSVGPGRAELEHLKGPVSRIVERNAFNDPNAGAGLMPGRKQDNTFLRKKVRND